MEVKGTKKEMEDLFKKPSKGWFFKKGNEKIKFTTRQSKL